MQVLQRFNMLPRMLRSPGQYAGVRNGGATCYMNAVFQQLFMQPSIRARILGSAEVRSTGGK
jgi:ubiquitin carboxyl-terminal hydrolase 9/24